MNAVETILVGISGIAWTIVYLDLIRKGYKQKSCGMPVFALALNLAWEWIYGLDGFFGSRSFIPAQSAANIVWAICDIFVLSTWIRYGKSLLPERMKSLFAPYTILVLLFGFAMQMAFYLGCPDAEIASIYSAFAQNAAMSAMFLTDLFRRKDTQGLSMTIAVCKWLGTLTPTIYGQLNGNGLSVYILITGSVCCVLDILYIVLLRKRIQAENSV